MECGFLISHLSTVEGISSTFLTVSIHSFIISLFILSTSLRFLLRYQCICCQKIKRIELWLFVNSVVIHIYKPIPINVIILLCIYLKETNFRETYNQTYKMMPRRQAIPGLNLPGVMGRLPGTTLITRRFEDSKVQSALPSSPSTLWMVQGKVAASNHAIGNFF